MVMLRKKGFWFCVVTAGRRIVSKHKKLSIARARVDSDSRKLFVTTCRGNTVNYRFDPKTGKHVSYTKKR